MKNNLVYFPDNSHIEVIIDGAYEFTNWTSFSFSRNMGNVVGTGSLTMVVNDLTLGDLWILRESASVEVKAVSSMEKFSESVIMRGYITGVSDTINSSGRSISISIADKTIDLVQCSAIVPSGTWTKATLERIAKDICKPFDIFVDGQAVDFKSFGGVRGKKELYEIPFDSFSINPGETAFNTISRACNARGILTMTDNWGNLILSSAYSDQQVGGISLTLGENLYSLSRTTSYVDTFSEYNCYGQSTTKGKGWGAGSTTSKATSKDSNVTRYRPLNFQIETNASKDVMQQRANWEAQVRSGRADSFVASVPGWFTNLGAATSERRPWQVNSNVRLIADAMGVDQTVMITAVEFSLSEAGRMTSLTLQDPSTYANSPGSLVVKRKKPDIKKNNEEEVTDESS